MFDARFFAPADVLLLGAVSGFLFGFLLQKAGLTRFEVIVGQFLLRDFTVLKVMLTAIAVGGIGLWAFHTIGWLDDLSPKPAHLLANALGGALFGIGMAVLGYCPGTAVAALGDGSRHALAGVLGMFFGAAAYAETYGWFRGHVLPIGDLGPVTLPEVLGVSPFLLLALLAAVDAGLALWQDRRPRRLDVPVAGGSARGT